MNSRFGRIAIAAASVAVLGVLLGLVLTGRLAPRPVAPTATAPATTASPPAQPQRTHALKPAGLTLRGQVQAAKTHGIVAPSAGTVVALSAPEGQPVVQGQLVMQLDVPALRQQLAAAQKQLTDLKALRAKSLDPDLRDKLQTLEREAQESVIRQKKMQEELATFEREHPDAATILTTHQAVEAEAASAALAYERAMREFNHVQEAATRTGKPPANFSEVSSRFQAAQQRNRDAQARLEQVRQARSRLRDDIVKLNILRQRVTSGKHIIVVTRAALDKFRKNPAVAMVAQGEQQVKQATDRIESLQKQIGKLALKAPVSGMLREIKARPGQAVKAGQTLAVVGDTGGARLVFDVGSKDATRVEVGMKAQVILPDQKRFEAAVGQIVPEKAVTRIFLVPVKQTDLPVPGTALTAEL